jgi:hypothetical protein
VDDDHNMQTKLATGKSRGFFATLLVGIVRDAIKFVIAFSVGTGASAIACWYYGIPLVFSLLGGILVLSLALALLSDSW